MDQVTVVTEDGQSEGVLKAPSTPWERGLVHELRNVGFWLSSTVDAMSVQVHEGPALDYLPQLRRTADRLAHLAEALETLFQLPELMRSRHSARQMFERVCGTHPEAQRIHAGRGQDLSFTVDGSLLERALRELVDNALTHAGSAIVHFEAGEEEGCLVVEDEGPGLPPRVQESFATPFVRGARGGPGLGLTLVQRVAILHGGTLDFDRERLVGTSVRLSWALDSGQAVQTPDGSRGSPAAAGPRPDPG